VSARAGRRVVVVTGTDTGVGKTVVTAAVAVQARSRGTVTVVKPVQTGVGPESADPDAPGDVDEVHRLTGCAVQEYAALPDPLAPDSAARLRGIRLPPVHEHADRVRVLAEFEDTVVVEGAGGLLVRLDTDGGTLLDLAAHLAATLPPTTALEVVVVCRAGLGTLNHTELTCTALRDRGIEPTALAVGSWPAEPDLAERLNRDDLPRVTGVPLGWVVPAGVGGLGRDAFVAAAPGWRVG
jgi:dethiobiotin synthetase